jgi:hypothetical protein
MSNTYILRLKSELEKATKDKEGLISFYHSLKRDNPTMNYPNIEKQIEAFVDYEIRQAKFIKDYEELQRSWDLLDQYNDEIAKAFDKIKDLV